MYVQLHSCSCPSAVASKTTGFTLIELMIVIAVIAIILMMAIPAYSNYAIRAKMGEALALTAAAKTAVASTCIEDPTLTGLTNSKAGYGFNSTQWVNSIMVSGDCTQPVITAATQNTGAPGDPDIVLTGNLMSSTGKMTWICTSIAANSLLPRECRS
jgi:type IV pilus assembly protein PilA